MNSSISEKKKRVRLSPVDRREQLLDATKEFVVKNGLNALTMESVARIAKASKPLLYKYFDSRLHLLQALLIREEELRYYKISASLANAKDYTEMIYAVVNHNFDERSRGDVVGVLSDQPDIEAALQSVKENRRGGIGRILVNAMTKEYDISKKDAQKIMSMSSAASYRAAELYANSGGDRDSYVELAVQFIYSGQGSFS